MNQYKVLVKNRRAFYDYEILEKIEAGIVLVGTEVKSIRLGKVTLSDGWVDVSQDGAWLKQVHISHYRFGNIFNHDPMRPRAMLLHKSQIKRLRQQSSEKGLSLVPLQIHLQGQYIKVVVGVGRGKKFYDKRDSKKKKEIARDIERAIKR